MRSTNEVNACNEGMNETKNGSKQMKRTNEIK